MPRATALKTLPKIPDSLLEELTRDNPRGMSFGYDGVNAVRKTVRALQWFYAGLGLPILLTLDEAYESSDADPDNIIVLHCEKTTLIPLRFRKKLIYVAGEPIMVAHDDGAAMLALKIACEVERVLRSK